MRRTFLSLLFLLAFTVMPVSLAAAEGELPDLIAGEASFEDDGTIVYSITNNGSADMTGEESLTVTVTATDEHGTVTAYTDTPMTSSDLAFLAVGGTSSVRTDVVPEPGIYNIEVCVDVNEEVEESDETNNCTTTQAGWRTNSSSSSSTTTDTTSDDEDVEEMVEDTADEDGEMVEETAEDNVSDESDDTEEEMVDEDVEGDEDDEEVELTEEGEDEGRGGGGECNFAFGDVDENADYYDAVCALWTNDIVHGRTDESFAPEDYILRGEAAKIIARLFGYVDMTVEWDRENEASMCEISETSYTDLSADDPYICPVEALTEESVISGYEDGTFRAHQEMEGEEITDLLANVGYAEEVEEELTRGAFVSLIWDLYSAE